jgi:hypothetical protein
MTHEPKHYNLPDHLARIFESKEFTAAAKEAAKTADEFRHAVTVELKALTEAARKEELRRFEKELGTQALTHALEKLKAGTEAELKAFVSRVRNDEHAAFESEVGKRALAAVTK